MRTDMKLKHIIPLLLAFALLLSLCACGQSAAPVQTPAAPTATETPAVPQDEAAPAATPRPGEENAPKIEGLVYESTVPLEYADQFAIYCYEGGYRYIDMVREKAGLEGVLDSWSNYSTHPSKPATQSGMREIIRRERLIELAFEGQRFFDLRRWKIAADYWNLPPTKYNFSRRDMNLTYKPVVYDAERKVKASFRDYLFPISEADLHVNKNLVQTYGW